MLLDYWCLDLPMSEEIRRLMITVGLLFAVLLMILASCIAIFCCCRQKIEQTHPRIKTTLTSNFYEQYTTIAPPTIQDCKSVCYLALS